MKIKYIKSAEPARRFIYFYISIEHICEHLYEQFYNHLYDYLYEHLLGAQCSCPACAPAARQPIGTKGVRTTVRKGVRNGMYS